MLAGSETIYQNTFQAFQEVEKGRLNSVINLGARLLALREIGSGS
jgi:hypothetical protein